MEDITTIKELLAYFLRLIYVTEKELSETLPKIKDELTAPDLKEFFGTESEGKQKQQMRFEMLLRLLNEDPSSTSSNDIVKYLVSTQRKLKEKHGSSDTADHIIVTLYYALINYTINIHEEAIKCSTSLGYDIITRMLKRSIQKEGKLTEKLRILEKSHALPESDAALY
ncbi:DUF892 family protein [Fulvivirga sp. 29W222]|uniref:DUF892 family protein n=1 Tax=Fulvivirga marina TaxID=2494733 RepID=A0A937KFW9_9BACT|nr:DUF892 family protein [Fulvivirga marina]MBL6448745.1 DUF892 family protein [Fulvivirga marina]